MCLAGSIFLTTTIAAGAEMEGIFCEIFQERAIKVNQRVAQSELLEFLEVHAEVDCLEKNYVLEWSVRNQFLREITSIRKSMRNHLLNMMCASDAGWESALNTAGLQNTILSIRTDAQFHPLS